MSDGNFNRALLPHTPYASGLKMGQARAMRKAEEAFVEWLREREPQMTEEELADCLQSFKRLLG